MSKQQMTTQDRNQQIKTVGDALNGMKNQLSMALPSHIKPERMIRVALTAVHNTPKLLECDRNSFYLAVLRAAQLGLEPDGILGQAYLIPYAGKVQLIAGYKGLIDLARRSGEVSNIIAKEVYQHDEFEVDFSKDMPFVHKPKLEGDRGEVRFFWAMAKFKDGGFHWDYMTVGEVLAIRDRSSGWQTALKFQKTADSPWKRDFVEMGKKTVIRRIAKHLPMSVQRAAIVEDLVDSGSKFKVDDMGDVIMGDENVIEGDSAPMEAENTSPQMQSLKDKLQAKKRRALRQNLRPKKSK